MVFLKTIISAIFNALFGQVRQGVDEKRDDQAHRDAGQATEIAASNQKAVEVVEAMANAKSVARADGGAEKALDGATFLMPRAPMKRKCK